MSFEHKFADYVTLHGCITNLTEHVRLNCILSVACIGYSKTYHLSSKFTNENERTVTKEPKALFALISNLTQRDKVLAKIF